MRTRIAIALLLALPCGCAAFGAALLGPSRDAAVAAVQAGGAALKAGIDSAVTTATFEIDKAAAKADAALASGGAKFEATLAAKATEFAAKRDAALEAGKPEEAALWDSLVKLLAGLGVGGTIAYRLGLGRGVGLQPATNGNGGGAPKPPG